MLHEVHEVNLPHAVFQEIIIYPIKAILFCALLNILQIKIKISIMIFIFEKIFISNFNVR